MAWEGIGNALAGAGDWMSKNPEQFAIIADTIGKNLDPNNAFAGVGTMMGQSSLAAQAMKKQKEERALLLKTLLGGTGLLQGAETPAADPQAPGASDLGAGNTPVGVPNVTAPELKGPTSVTYKAGPDGTVTQNVVSNTTGKQPTQGTNLTDILPLLLAQSGNQVNLTGLTPEQILGFARNDLGMGELGNMTVGELFDARYREMAGQAALTNAASAAEENRAQVGKYAIEARIKMLEELRAQAKHPAELMKINAEILKLKSGAAQDYASAGNLNASARKTGVETQGLTTQQNLLNDLLSSDPNIKFGDLSDAAKLGILGPAAGQDALTAEANRLAADLKLTEDSAAAVGDSGKPVNAQRIYGERWNREAPASSNFGYFYAIDTPGWTSGPTNEMVRVDLPDGVTMAHVRALAEKRHTKVENVLREINAQGE